VVADTAVEGDINVGDRRGLIATLAKGRNEMAQATTRPNVPVFVSSTFTDMQVYRRKIQDALTQLETVVRGMEQFGSKPGSPMDECLNVVQSCRLYVGVFGMRYGTVPDGHDKSMTQIEYDEAQRLGLPSLIYLLNETILSLQRMLRPGRVPKNFRR
jgi:hypothetical protein